MSLTDDDKTWISHQIASEVATLAKTMDGRFERLDEKMERLETTLLTEFHKWASPQEARMRTHAAALRAIDLEMEAVSDRVKNLEDQRPH